MFAVFLQFDSSVFCLFVSLLAVFISVNKIYYSLPNKLLEFRNPMSELDSTKLCGKYVDKYEVNK